MNEVCICTQLTLSLSSTDELEKKYKERFLLSWHGEMATPCDSVLGVLIQPQARLHSRLLEDMMLFAVDMFFLAQRGELKASFFTRRLQIYKQVHWWPYEDDGQ